MDLVPSYGITSLPLFKPDLNEFAPKLKNALSKLFEQVEVTVVDCPDLTKKPFTLAGKALGGRKVIADIGGTSYLTPCPPQPMPMYSLVDLAQRVGFKEAHILGASCAPIYLIGAIAEYMPNLLSTIDQETNKTMVLHGSYMAKMEDDSKFTVKRFDSDCVNLLANVFVCENKPGKVLKVHVKKRIHEDGKSLSEAMREILVQLYPDKFISMGGVFMVKSGSINIHIMPCAFGKEKLDTSAKVDKWLNFFDAQAPIVCLSTLHSRDPGMDLRMEHTHCFSHHGQGGHYHYDTSPDSIEYEGYFDFCDEIQRVDQPKK